MAEPNTTVIAGYYPDTMCVVGGPMQAVIVGGGDPRPDIVAVPERQGPIGPQGISAYASYVAAGGKLSETQWSAPAALFPAASEADAIAGIRNDVVITPATLQGAIAAYLAANPIMTIASVDTFDSTLISFDSTTITFDRIH